MTAAITPNERLRYRPALDGIRGIAILLVLLGHAGVPGFGPLAGTAGVTLFFALSGFLITALLVGEFRGSGRIDLPAFYWRRGLRLLPAFLATAAVAGIALVLLGRGGEVLGVVLPPLLYVGNWTLVAGHDLGPLNHTWSLSVEEQFYVLWPLALVGLALLRRPRAAMLVAGFGTLLTIAWRLLLSADPATSSDRILWATDTRGDALLIGCAVALAVDRGRRFPWPRVGVFLGLAAIGSLVIVEEPWYGRIAPLLTVAALGSALLLWSLETWSPRWLAWRPLVGIGVISYGLYLWHYMPRQLLIPRLDSWPAWSLSGLQLVLALGLALLSWRYIETPFLRLKGSVPRLPHRRRDRAAPEAQGADTQTIPTSTADAPSTATTRI